MRKRQQLILPGKRFGIVLTLAELDRFRKFIREEDGHWIWTGHKDGNGYGQFWLRGKSRWCHRISYAAFVGAIPTGWDVDHKSSCRRPDCINPACLKKMQRHAHNVKSANTPRKTLEEVLETW